MKQRKIAILVPAHNEEEVLEETLLSLSKLVSPKDLYVVDDGSTDSTREIAGRYTENVFSIYPNAGKATAMNTAIKKYNLSERYEYLMPMDADTLATEEFLKTTLSVLENDKKKELACIIGGIKGKKYNWLTSYRIWEYEISQTIHKSAQFLEDAIIVCPGCSTIYRAEIFKKIEIPTGTLTEDMDFTFLLHREKLGRIYFVNNAFVLTQDPRTLKDLSKQLKRWYTGFWQCLWKHNIPWGGQSLDLEVALLATEGIFNSLVVVLLLLLSPFVIINSPKTLIIPILADLLFFMIPTLVLTGKRHKFWKIFKYLPHFYLLRIFSSFIFLESFLNVTFGKDFKMKWCKASRYVTP